MQICHFGSDLSTSLVLNGSGEVPKRLVPFGHHSSCSKARSHDMGTTEWAQGAILTDPHRREFLQNAESFCHPAMAS